MPDIDAQCNGHAQESAALDEPLPEEEMPFQALWDAKSPVEQLGEILTSWPVQAWVKEPALSILAPFRSQPLQWAQVMLAWQERAPFVKRQLFEDAIDEWRRQMGMEETRASPRLATPPRVALEILPPGDWQERLLCTKEGEPKQTVNNISLLLEHASPWHEDWWFDTVRGVAMVGTHPLDDACIVSIARWLGDDARMAVQNLKLVGNCCVAICQQHPRDLLKEWLAALPEWDHELRLTSWLWGIAGAPDTPYGRDVSRLLPVSMVARALNPGCQYRQVVLLEGAENTGKSTLVRTLASSEWLYECTGGLEGKEAYMVIQGHWIAELPELHAMSKTDENRFKGFITQVEDTWIPKYSNFSTKKPRRTIFIGTLNPEGNQAYLRGQTGNTRYLPIPTGTIYPELLARCREQLFAEALIYYKDHPDTWWQLSNESETEAVQLREDRRISSVYEGILQEWLDGRERTSWEEIAEHVFHLDPANWKDRSLQMQVAQALAGLGWHTTLVREGTKVRRVWRPRASV